jgi:hypothetical protein
MFADAIERASAYTRPVIVSTRTHDGKVGGSVAAYTVLNEDGWILTAAHVFSTERALARDKERFSALAEGRSVVDGDESLKPRARERRLKDLRPDPKWLTGVSYWWGSAGATVERYTVKPTADLAVAKLEPFDPESVASYPVFGRGEERPRPGEFLCKLGFPFHRVRVDYDETTGAFSLQKGVLPVPRFPLEGMFTRNVSLAENEGGRKAKFLETSTPGLVGQSGGPVFDPDGVVWGMQSRTVSMPMGIRAVVGKPGGSVEEHQIMNVALAAHVDEIVVFLDEQGIEYRAAEV